MHFLPTSSALAKIATPSTVSIGQVRSLHRRFSVYISLCGCFCGYSSLSCPRLERNKTVINIDCDTMFVVVNVLCWMQDWDLEVSRHLFASRLNTHSQTDRAIEDQYKLKTWTQQPVPMMSEHSAHLTSLPFGFRTWLWRHTRLKKRHKH